MTWRRIRGRWMALKGRALELWGMFTGNEQQQMEGHRDILIGVLEARLRRTREPIVQEAER